MIEIQPSEFSNFDKKVYRLFEKFCQPGVYAIINEKDKRIFISHSSNILNSSARVINQISNKVHPIKQMVRDRKRFKVVILDIETFKPARLIKLEQQIIKYKTLGYTIYNKTNHTPKYKATYYITNNGECWVALVNSRYKKFLIKEFVTINEAKEYLNNTRLEDIIKLYMTNQKV